MQWDTSYSCPDYVLDQELTEEIRYRLDSGESGASLKIKVAPLLAPIAIFLIVWPLTHILIAAIMATIALAIFPSMPARGEIDRN